MSVSNLFDLILGKLLPYSNSLKYSTSFGHQQLFDKIMLALFYLPVHMEEFNDIFELLESIPIDNLTDLGDHKLLLLVV